VGSFIAFSFFAIVDSSAKENINQFNSLRHKVCIHLKEDKTTLLPYVILQPMMKKNKCNIFKNNSFHHITFMQQAEKLLSLSFLLLSI